MTEQELIAKGWYKTHTGNWMRKGVHISLTSEGKKAGGLTADEAAAVELVVAEMQKRLEKP